MVYAPIPMTTSETTNLEHHVYYIDRTCSRLIVKNWTAYSHFGDTMDRRLQQIRNTRKLLLDIAQRRQSDKRRKRGLFNYVGKISKTSFGTMDDDDDAQFYHDQINCFEQGSTVLMQLMKQQLTAVKSTPGTFNETLMDVEYDEKKMREGLSQLQTCVTSFGSQIDNATYLLSLKITIENHTAKALDASHAIQQTLDILMDSTADAQKGTLLPCVASPTLLLDAL